MEIQTIKQQLKIEAVLSRPAIASLQLVMYVKYKDNLFSNRI